MSEFRPEKPENKAKMDDAAIPRPSDAKEIPESNTPVVKSTSGGPDWRARLAAMKIKAVAPKNGGAKPPVTVPDATPIEKLPHQVHDAAEAKIGEAVIEQEALQKQVDSVLNAEALYIETLGEKSDDRDELYKSTFIAAIGEVAGLNLDQIREKILKSQRVIYDERVKIQSWMAMRGELLKDASSEELQKRLKEDFAFKPPKIAKSGDGKGRSSTPKKKEDPFEQMKRTMVSKFIAKGMSQADAESKADKKIAALKGDDES